MSVIQFENNGIRFDLQIIASLIEPGSRVLDLGCGEGNLLVYLRDSKNVKGVGIEKDEEKVAICIRKGLSVVQGNINHEIRDYPDNSFDYIVVSQTLQQIYEPAFLIKEILRIGKKAIVSFPNFSYWKVRFQLLFTGYAPITKELPYEWYNTPNIRVITLKDFRKFSRQMGFKILEEIPVVTSGDRKRGKVISGFSNLRATYGIFLIGLE